MRVGGRCPRLAAAGITDAGGTNGVNLRSKLRSCGVDAVGITPAGHQPVTAPVVRVAQGQLQGTVQVGANAFLGIPFAAAPVGELRWRAPQSPPDWPGVHLADRYGNACLQSPPLLSTLQSEDCLYLNVWTPAGAQAAQLPVMVWLHGGGFAHASGAEPRFNGAQLAARGVVVVTVNYRLGRFGFFAHPALTREDPGGLLANFGLLDQIAALEWVRRNAAAFGGDPDNVTLFGQSAGGVSICQLLASPLAKGLLQRAIVESGVFFSGPPGVATTLAQAEVSGVVAARSWGLSDPTASDLRGVPATTVLSGTPAITWPVVDGRIVTSDLRSAFETGHFARVPLLLGTNTFEVGFSPVPSQSPAAAAAAAFEGLFSDSPQRLSSNWAAVQSLYDGYGTQDTAMVKAQLATDMFYTVATREAARIAGRHGVPTYLYVFSYLRPSQRGHIPGPIHTDEILAVFGTMDQAAEHGQSEETQRIVEDVQSRWVQFARSGRPSEDQALWPKFVPGEERLLEFTTAGPVVRSHYAQARLDLAEKLAAKRVKE